MECHYWPVRGQTTVKPPTPAPTPAVKVQCSDTTFKGNNDAVISAEYYMDCQSLPSAPTFANDIVSIGVKAFYNCSSLTTVVLPKNLQYLHDSAFEQCAKLSSVTFQNNYVVSLGAYAFRRCLMLTTIVIPRYIGSAVSCMLDTCTGLSEIKIQENSCCDYTWTNPKFDMYVHDKLTVIDTIETRVVIASPKITSLSVPSGVNCLWVQCYRTCRLTGDIVVPEYVIYLDQDCFCSCGLITSITLKGPIESINQFAFRATDACTSYTITNGNGKYKSINGVIYSSNDKELLFYPTAKPDEILTLPYSLEGFSAQCFTSLTCKIKAFEGAGGYLTLDASKVFVYRGDTIVKFAPAFAPNTYTITSKFKTMGVGCIANCHVVDTLRCVEVHTIKEWAFYQLTAKHVVFDDYSTITHVEPWSFHGADLLEFTFPCIESVPTQMFSYASLKSITFMEGVKVIGSSSFSMCIDLAEIKLPTSLVSIEARAFEQTIPTEVILPSTHLYNIEERAFFACSKLLYVLIPHCVKYVRENAFADCTSAQYVLIENCNSCCHEKAFRSSDKRLQPECVSTYHFTYHRSLPGIRPVWLFLRVILGALINDFDVIYM